MVYRYFFGVLLSKKTIIFDFLQFKGNFVHGQITRNKVTTTVRAQNMQSYHSVPLDVNKSICERGNTGT